MIFNDRLQANFAVLRCKNDLRSLQLELARFFNIVLRGLSHAVFIVLHRDGRGLGHLFCGGKADNIDKLVRHDFTGKPQFVALAARKVLI